MSGSRRRTTSTYNVGRRLTAEERDLRIDRTKVIMKVVWRLVALVSIIGIGYLVVVQGWNILLNSKNLVVKDITIRGNHAVKEREILKIAQINPGQSILKVHPADMIAELVKNPWIKEVNVQRQLPDRIVIDVIERLPQAVISLERLYLLDEDGVPFIAAPNDMVSKLPLVTGLDRHLFTENPQKFQEYISWAKAALDSVSRERGLENLEQMEIFVSPISGVDVELFDSQKKEHLRLALGFNDEDGQNGFEQKLRRAVQTLTILKERGKKARIIYLDNSKHPQLVYAKLVKN